MGESSLDRMVLVSALPMQSPFISGVVGAMLGLLSACVVAAAGGFFEDAAAVCFWSVPAILFTGSAASRLVGRFRTQAGAAAGSLTIGVVAAYTWTFVVARMLGPWFGAFGSPILILFAVAIVNGLFTALVLARRSWAGALALAVVSGLALGVTGVYGFPWILARLTDQRQIEVVCLRWNPGVGALRAAPFMDGKVFGNLAEEDLEVLRPMLAGGRLELLHASGNNSMLAQRFGRPLRVLVAFETDAIKPALVPLPQGERLAVAYRDGSWVVHPAGAPGPRRLRLSPSDANQRGSHAGASVEGP